MMRSNQNVKDDGRVRFFDLKPDVADIKTEVLAGLMSASKRISPKYFYDERGSVLFEAITELPEYYPTRTEIGILEDHGHEIAREVGDASFLIEYGSGSSKKSRVLLESLRPSSYMPVDISRDHLLASAEAIAADYDWLNVYPTCADYSSDWELPVSVDEGVRRVAFFPGSSIGNFEPDDAQRFLAGVRRTVGEDGALIIGVDLKKPTGVLERAYNDSEGVTAEFNRNVLRHLNSCLEGEFDPSAFDHEARYNEDEGRVEMYLVSTARQTVRLGGEEVSFEKGEAIHTENSYKYHAPEFASLADEAGFDLGGSWRDPSNYFEVFLFE
jgi:dimethylhistidine N-methyltransferase